MWVVKLGGSLNRDASLPRWLALLAELGGGRVIVVPGGGGFADQAREIQSWWRLSDLAAHNMAVLGMAQSAALYRGLCPELQPASGEAQIGERLRRGQTVVWQPFEVLREGADELTHWGVTADSLALWLAQRLHAERLLVVKSCVIDRSRTLEQLVDAGVLDAEFAQRAAAGACPVELLDKSELPRARALLLQGALCTARLR